MKEMPWPLKVCANKIVAVLSYVPPLEGRQQRADIMPIHDDGMPAESSPACAVGLHIMLQHRGVALSQSIDVDDGAEIVQTVWRPTSAASHTEPSTDSPSPIKT